MLKDFLLQLIIFLKSFCLAVCLKRKHVWEKKLKIKIPDTDRSRKAYTEWMETVLSTACDSAWRRSWEMFIWSLILLKLCYINKGLNSQCWWAKDWACMGTCGCWSWLFLLSGKWYSAQCHSQKVVLCPVLYLLSLFIDANSQLLRKDLFIFCCYFFKCINGKSVMNWKSSHILEKCSAENWKARAWSLALIEEWT